MRRWRSALGDEARRARLRASLCPVRAARLSAPPPGLPGLLEYRAAPPFYTLPPTSPGTRHPRSRGGPPAPRPPRASPESPRAPSVPAPLGTDPRHGAGGLAGAESAPGQSRRERPWGFPPARSGTAGLGNPLTQISLYGIHPVRGGVTDGKRSRLQPSAAGGTGRDGTRQPLPPRPGQTLRGLRDTHTALGAAGTKQVTPPRGAVPPQVTPSPQGGPAQPCRGARCSKEGGEEGPRLGRAALCAASQTPSPALSGVWP